jgi:hypothetical protein
MAKYCSNCGNEVKETQDVCLQCGHRLTSVHYGAEGDTFGWAVLGFFFPIVGLILYLVWKDERPKASLSAGKGALISVVINVVIIAFAFTLIFSVAPFAFI